MRHCAIIAAVSLSAGLAGCASGYDWTQRSATYQPDSAGIYSSSGTAAGWGDRYPNGYGYANPLTDPGPAGAGRR